MAIDLVVSYNGEYPNACRGTLTITLNGEVIYRDAYCCRSTGGVSFDDSWNEHIHIGRLVWNGANDPRIPECIRATIVAAVEEELNRVQVCCGGCW